MKAKAKKRGKRKKTAKRKSTRRVGASKKGASRKRATKKRAGKKKATKKKKYSSKKAIRIKGSIPVRWSQKLRMKKATNKPESVHWVSKDVAYRVTFTGSWPFSTAPDVNPNTVTVPAGGASNEFVADQYGAKHHYKYAVSPPPKKTPKKPNPDVVLDD